MARAIGGGGGIPTPMVQLASFAPWALAGWAGSAVVLILLRWWRLAALALLAVGLHAWWAVPPAAARELASAPPAARPGVPLRVMTVNAAFGHADAATVARLVAEGRVDLLAVEELTQPLADALDASVSTALPYQEVRAAPAGRSIGTGVWSRYPLRPLPPLPMRNAIPRAVLQLPGSDPVTLTVVHTDAPTPTRVRGWRSDLGLLASTVRSTPGPQLMLGDFNASRDHGPFRDVLGSGVVDAADALPGLPHPGFTWPAGGDRMPLAVRIDHVLVTPDVFSVRAVSTVRVPGTDHLAVIADLVLRSG